MLMNNNERCQIRITKNALSNIIAIEILDNNKTFNLIIFIKQLYSSKSK